MSTGGWIGVDLDGTIAHYTDFIGPEHIGEPILPMLARVKAWLAEGKDVRIFTARVWEGGGRDISADRALIEAWCEKHIGQKLVVTNVKDWEMHQLWDDRAIQIEKNTGRRMDGGA